MPNDDKTIKIHLYDDMSNRPWVASMYEHADAGDREAAIDLMFEAIDDLLCDGRFAEVDEAIASIDVDRLDSHLLVGLLSITLAPRDLLQSRPEMVRRIETRLRDLVPDRADTLLSGMR